MRLRDCRARRTTIPKSNIKGMLLSVAGLQVINMITGSTSVDASESTPTLASLIVMPAQAGIQGNRQGTRGSGPPRSRG